MSLIIQERFVVAEKKKKTNKNYSRTFEPKNTNFTESASSTKSPDCVGSFLTQIGKHKLLTKEEEIIHGKHVRAAMTLLEAHPSLKMRLSDRKVSPEQVELFGLPEGDLNFIFGRAYRAKNKLIECNLRLVVVIAKRYTKIYEGSLIDLVQEGSVGLNRAAEKFDPERGCRFSTYASWWIRQSVTRYLTQHSRVIRLPVVVYEQITRLKRVSKILLDQNGKAPNLQELARAMELTPERIRSLQAWSRRVCSFDVSVGDSEDSCSLIDMIESPDQQTSESMEKISYKLVVDSLLAECAEKQRNILIWRYGLDGELPMSTKEIGKILGVSHERIRQICNEQRKAMRERAEEKGIVPSDVFA